MGESKIVVEGLAIPDVKIITPRKFADHRGFFSETYSRQDLEGVGIDLDFVQDNQSLSSVAGTLRGLHFQIPPFAQDKLVRVLRGRILDVAVDIRVGSPTYGRHVTAEISAEKWNQIFVPVGFAHGFVTLEPDTEIVYKVSRPYSVACDRGILWSDPDLGIAWPFSPEAAVLSEKDAKLPLFRDLPAHFRYGAG